MRRNERDKRVPVLHAIAVLYIAMFTTLIAWAVWTLVA